MKKPKVTFSKPSKAVIREGMARLRYMAPENVAKDFKSPAERKAIAAVFKWMSLNFVCAWKLKRPCHYRTNARMGRAFWSEVDAYVLDKEQWAHAEKALGIKDK